LPFAISLSAQISFDFESSNLSQWTQSPTGRWNTTTQLVNSQFISVLKHSFDASAAQKDRISTPLPSIKLSEENLLWRFKIGYEYLPSSSNNWAVFFMAEQNAESMLPDSKQVAFIIGVNFDGSSDDLIKIWKSNSSGLSVIHNTNVNWQTEIGVDKIAAFNIERNYKGEWIFQFSTEGVFTNMQTIASFTDNSIVNPLHFGLYYSYTSTADRKLYFDDFYFHNKPANENNRTSIVQASQNPLANKTILSSDFENDTEVFAFRISDLASGDNLPTKVSRLHFLANGSNSADWQQLIRQISIYTSQKITIENTFIDKQQLTIYFAENELTIPDGESVECILKLSFNASKITDKSVFAIQFDTQNVGNSAFISGSAFAAQFPNSVVSPQISFDVAAVKLQFTELPISAKMNTNFNAIVSATDVYGNTDSDANAQLMLTLAQGSGVLTADNNFGFLLENGKCVLTGLHYNKPEAIVLKIRDVAGFFSDIFSSKINILGDEDSEIKAADGLFDTKISSLVDSRGEAVEVLRFVIEDKETTDNVPTIIRKLNIKNKFPTKNADWTNSIAGIGIEMNGKPLIIGNVQISDQFFNFEIADEQLKIENGGSRTVSLFIYLNKSKIVDNSELQFVIPSSGHFCSADSSGSLLSSIFSAEIASPVFEIQVEASKLYFAQIPNVAVRVGEGFETEIRAVDENLNTDLDFLAQVQLFSENGIFHSLSENYTIEKGVLVCNDVYFETAGLFTLTAKTPNLFAAKSNEIVVADSDSKIENTSYLPNEIVLQSNTESQFIELIELKITDLGTSDNLPTLISVLNFQNPFSATWANSASLFSQIILINNQGDTIRPTSYLFDIETLVLKFDTQALRIENATSQTYKLLVLFDFQNISDHSVLQFRINSKNHQCSTHKMSSLLANEMPFEIVSAKINFDVVASQLSIANQLFMIEKHDFLEIEILATDSFFNIDKDVNESILLNVKQSEYQVDMLSGRAQINQMRANENAVMTFYANCENNSAIKPLKSFDIEVVDVIEKPIDASFENKQLNDWKNTQNWLISDVNPINGNSSLNHNQFSDNEQDGIFRELNFDKTSEGTYLWQISVKTGNWLPTSSTNFKIYCMASEPLNQPIESAFYIEISAENGFYCLKLNKIENSKTMVLVSAPIEWTENQQCSFILLHNSKGVFSLFYQFAEGKPLMLAGSAYSEIAENMQFTGINYTFSASRAGLFWIDNFRVSFAKTAAKIQKINSIGNHQIEVFFTTEIDLLSAADKNNYAILDAVGKTVALNRVEVSQNQPNRVLIEATEFDFGNYQLSVCGVKDKANLTICDTDTFGYQVANGYVAISEIMFKPSDVFGLPNAEYIELFNASGEAIQLKNWNLKIGSSTIILPDYRIKSNEYLIVTDIESVLQFENAANVLGFENFPSISNTGTLIELVNTAQQTISWVDFRAAWISDEFKQMGGWSLERIDIQNICGEADNWQASENSKGGTPANVNSIARSNSDDILPSVSHFSVISATELQLIFTEPMFAESVENRLNYSVFGTQPAAVGFQMPQANIALLTFDVPFSEHQTYFLKLENMLQDCAHNPLQNADLLRFALPLQPDSADIAINEIMFNPLSGSVDFVELYNRSNKTFDLNDFYFARKNDLNETIDIKQVANVGTLFFPNDYVVVCSNSALITDFYFAPDTAQFVVSDALPSLPDDEGSLVLLSKTGQQIDFAQYSKLMHFSLISSDEGISLERVNFNQSALFTDNWQSASATVGYATPGYKNSQYFDYSTENQTTIFSFSAETISPNNDGVDDELYISYQLENVGYMANVMIFDSRGYRVHHRIKNELWGTEGSFSWNGLSESGEALPTGIYVIYIELISPKGKVQTYKETCVVVFNY